MIAIRLAVERIRIKFKEGIKYLKNIGSVNVSAVAPVCPICPIPVKCPVQRKVTGFSFDGKTWSFKYSDGTTSTL